MTPFPPGAKPDVSEGGPPVLGSWNKVYAFIIGYLICIIIAFGVFTAAFNK